MRKNDIKIECEKDGDRLFVKLEGRLNTTASIGLESFFIDNLRNVKSVIIDCEKLNYVSSAGLRVFLLLQKKLNGALRFTNVCDLVKESFEMTGFADILTIE